MNKPHNLANKVRWSLCALMGGALAWLLAGCTTYRDAPRARGGYYEEQTRVGYSDYQPASEAESSYYVGIRSESDFYEPLSAYGRWEVVGSYGRCWIPGRVDREWRPYCNGYWQRTDAGWYWASDEPWGWATYHYGRWDLSAQFGWYWVPQTQWAPAWVSWHQGGGYVGWAPLYPSARVGRNGLVDVNVRVISPRAYVFVEERRFLEPVRPTTVIVNNTTIINKTVNITKIKVVNNTVINEGPQTTVIEQVSGRKVQAVPVRELRRQQEAAVAATIRTAPPGREKKLQPPVRTEAESRGTTVPAQAPRQIEKPVAITTEPATPVPKREVRAADEPKRATKAVEDEAKRARKEVEREPVSDKGKSAPASVEPKPEARRPAAIQESAEQKAAKQAEKQEKRADKSAKKTQPDSQRHGKKAQAETEQGGTNTVNKVHEKKGGE